MRAAIIETLRQKGKFELEQAVAVAEAMDMSVEAAQFVTVPVLDARFAEFKSGIDARFASVDLRLAELRADMDTKFARVDARFDTLEARINVKLLVLALLIIVVNLANGPLGNAVLNLIKHVL